MRKRGSKLLSLNNILRMKNKNASRPHFLRLKDAIRREEFTPSLMPKIIRNCSR